MSKRRLTWGQYLSLEFRGLLGNPRFIKAAYRLVIISSGLFLLWILSGNELDLGLVKIEETTPFQVYKTIWAMLAWLALIIIIPVPNQAKSDVESFDKSLDDYLAETDQNNPA